MFKSYPLSKLVGRRYITLAICYERYLTLGWQHFGNSRLPCEVRKRKLELLERAIRKDCVLKNSIIGKLQALFLQHNLSLSLLLDPMYGWRYLAADKLPTTEAQASEIITAVTMPAARLVMALYDETPSTYIPVSSLLSFFVFLAMFESKNPFLQKVKIRLKQKESKLSGLLKNSKVILAIVSSFRVKFRMAMAFNTAQLLGKNFKNNQQKIPSVLDYIVIFLYSTGQILTVRKRTTTKKGI